MSEHTKEPWRYELVMGSYLRIYSETNSGIVSGCGCCGSPNCEDADARRIVASVNACAGVPTELLEQCPAPFSELVRKRDELLSALTDLVNEPQDITTPAYQRALAVIAECESAKA